MSHETILTICLLHAKYDIGNSLHSCCWHGILLPIVLDHNVHAGPAESHALRGRSKPSATSSRRPPGEPSGGFDHAQGPRDRIASRRWLFPPSE